MGIRFTSQSPAEQLRKGLGDLHVLDGLVVEDLHSLTVGKYGHLGTGVTLGGKAEFAFSATDETARFVVCGDDHGSFGMIEGLFHHKTDGLIEAGNCLECLLQFVVVAMLVNVRLLIHHKGAVGIGKERRQIPGHRIFQSHKLGGGVNVIVAGNNRTVFCRESLLRSQNILCITAVGGVGGKA